jgi:hypothetical protein
MRSAEEIDKVLAVIRAAWLAEPDVRLGQLISAVVWDYYELCKIEDDELAKEIEFYSKTVLV